MSHRANSGHTSPVLFRRIAEMEIIIEMTFFVQATLVIGGLGIRGFDYSGENRE